LVRADPLGPEPHRMLLRRFEQHQLGVAAIAPQPVSNVRPYCGVATSLYREDPNN
jgi:hypothetical protein